MRGPGQLAAQVAGGAAVVLLVATGVKTAMDGSAGGTEPSAVQAARTKAVVVDLVDGDTLRARTPAGRDLGRIRILGIDAPEVAHDPDPAECYGDNATATLAELAPVGSTVWLASDLTQDDRDVYGRMLRYVDHDGEDVARELLEAGAVRLYDSEPAIARARDYTAVLGAARAAGRGLWGVC